MCSHAHLLLKIADNTVVRDDGSSCQALTCLGKQLLQDESADDTSDRKTLLDGRMEGVELDIPAVEGST